MFLYYDISSYLIFLLPAIILAFIAQMRVSSAFSRYSKVKSIKNITAQDVVGAILSRAGLQDVSCRADIMGNLNDHYDLKAKKIRLSTPVYNFRLLLRLELRPTRREMQYSNHNKYAPLVIEML